MTRDPIYSSDPLVALFEDHLNGCLDEAGAAELETRLAADPATREQFVRYARMHTDLTLELRARRAADLAIESIRPKSVALPRRWVRRAIVGTAIAVGLLLAVALGRSLSTPADGTVAWLVNAQNCSWSDGDPPGDLRPGRTLRIDRGLAEIQFRCGARVVVEGPARLEFLSATSARLHDGKLAARVPPEASGFEILCPQGRVIDLGTEFGLSVSPTGAADVYVFEGRVEAVPAGGRRTDKVDLTRRQGARLAAGGVTVGPGDPAQFVRHIVPVVPTAPRVHELLFTTSVDKSLQDTAGLGTGMTHRLPGTGSLIPANDPNLRLVPEKGQLELITTNSDLNTQFRLGRGEYPGFRLADYGFTGTEDFELAATFPSIPALAGVGQLGLYCGARSDRAIRGGVIVSDHVPGQYTQFLVNNPDGNDTDTYRVGLNEAGTTLRMILRRTAGKYTLIVENQTVGFASTLAIRHPDFLDGEADLYVGLFGANTQSDVRRTIAVKDVKLTVWAAAPAER
jgi:hypothetical protein